MDRRSREPQSVKIGGRRIGAGEPVYVIAEIGINHNGSLETAKKLIEVAHRAGCDAVKFQKRTPELCTPRDMWEKMRETPWGYIPYIEYRRRIEFGKDEYEAIDRYCRQLGIAWTASVWDEPSAWFMGQFEVPFVKVPSAMLTNTGLLAATRDMHCPTMISTGMSTMAEIDAGIEVFGKTVHQGLLIAHATSTYPCPKNELNLKMIPVLMERYAYPIGYSGHEVGLATTLAAVALGATFVERHITLDRAMWGSDQAASVEPQGLARLVKDIRGIAEAMGDGVKQVYPSEMEAKKRLRPATFVPQSGAGTSLDRAVASPNW